MASLSVKDWFANKIASEVKRNISRCNVFAILRETEKAVYAVLDLGHRFSRTMWIPKSVLIEHPEGLDNQGKMHYNTIRTDNYDVAMRELNLHYDDFE